MRLRVEFKGFDTIYNKSRRFLNILKTQSIYAAIDGAEKTADIALQNLREKARTYGQSTDPIEESKRIVATPKATRAVAELKFTSKHAAIVEFGRPGWAIISTRPIKISLGTGAAEPRRGGIYRGWPIGKEQGAIVAFRAMVRLQSGYHYLTNAISGRKNRKQIRDVIASSLRRIIYSML